MTHLTTIELEVMEALAGNTVNEIALIMNRPARSVRRWCDQHGIETAIDPNLRGSTQIIFADDIAVWMEMRVQHGLTWSEIATAFRFSADSIRSAVSRAIRYGMDAYPPRPLQV